MLERNKATSTILKQADYLKLSSCLFNGFGVQAGGCCDPCLRV